MTPINERLASCPQNPQKLKYLDEAGALAHIARQELKYPDDPHGGRAYECVLDDPVRPGCGWWHITSKGVKRPAGQA